MYLITRDKMSYFDKEEREKEEEEEEEEDTLQNEESLPQIDSTFNKLVLLIKKTLYKNIVLSPPLNTKKAQDNKLLVSYLEKLSSLHKLCLHVQYYTLSEKKLNEIVEKYPNETRNMIKTLIKWLMTFFSRNNISDIMPYTHYLENKLYYYPLVQN